MEVCVSPGGSLEAGSLRPEESFLRPFFESSLSLCQDTFVRQDLSPSSFHSQATASVLTRFKGLVLVALALMGEILGRSMFCCCYCCHMEQLMKMLWWPFHMILGCWWSMSSKLAGIPTQTGSPSYALSEMHLASTAIKIYLILSIAFQTSFIMSLAPPLDNN